MALHKSLFRRLKNVLPLSVTISLLFYYTFRNEIDILNSFAETNHVPLTTGSGNVPDTFEKAPETLSFEELLDKNRFYPLLISNKDIEPFVDTQHLLSEYSTSNLYPMRRKVEVPVHKIKDKTKLSIQSERLEDEEGLPEMQEEVRSLFLKSFNQLRNQPDLYNNALNWPLDLIDTLDTLYVMELTDQFDDIVENTIKKINFKNPSITVNTDKFTVIDIAELSQKVLSSMLSAYELSKSPILLTKSAEVADFIIKSFDTPNRLPKIDLPVNSKLQNRFPYREINPSKLTSMTLEFIKLSELTKNDKYFNAAYHIYKTIAHSTDQFAIDFLFPNVVDPSGCEVLTPKEIDEGKHLKSNILKSIDENSQFVFCKETDKLTRSVDKITKDHNNLQKKNKRKQLITFDKDTIPLYSNLIQMLPLLKHHDILKLNDIAFEEDDDVDISKRDVIDPIKNVDASETKTTPKETEISSRALFMTLMRHVRDLMLYKPLVPLTLDNKMPLLFLTSMETHTRYIPTSNEIEVEMLRYFDWKSESCSFASFMMLGSKLFAEDKDFESQLLVKEIAQIAEGLTESCYHMAMEFKGHLPSNVLLDPCSDKEPEECIFDKNEKVQKVLANYYSNQETVADLDEEVDEHNQVGVKVMADDEKKPKSSSNEQSQQLSRRVMLFSKKEKSGHSLRNINSNAIDASSLTWKSHPDWPLWVNKLDNKRLLNPDVIHSILHMYRLTGDKIWRERGILLYKELIHTIENKFAGPKGVWKLAETDNGSEKIPHYWLSQTMKYYYLLFSKPSDFSLDNFIITMGGHLLGEKIEEKKQQYVSKA